MSDDGDQELGRTPLHGEHERLGARMVPFGGFAMPIQYAEGIRAEHQAVRSAAGMFDLSHMGELRVRGDEAEEFVSRVTTNDPTALDPGEAQYTVMCLEDGGIVDDLVVYRLDERDFRMVVNAANIAKDRAHLREHAGDFEVEIVDESEDVALVAVQGPRAQEVVGPLSSEPLEPVDYYSFVAGEIAGVGGMISRTGYTGEDGFELYVDAADAPGLWRTLLESGASRGLKPAGLGARDTLRLEMGYALYGQDIDVEVTPLEAGLGWLVKLEKGEFVGRDALRRQEEEGVERRLGAFRLTERGFPREGYPVVYGGEEVGTVRSGTVSPTLEEGIGTVYLPPGAEPGDELAVRIRDREVAGEVAETPFYTEGSLRR